jgi:hypothetical protein
VIVKAPEAQMILIAGPYRSGTNDDPALIKKAAAGRTGRIENDRR